MPVCHLDTGGNTDVNTYGTSATFSYDLTGKTSIGGGIHYSTNGYGSNLIGSETIAGSLSLNYNYRQKLTFGFGGSVGYNSVDSPSRDQSYEQIHVHLNYEVSDKLDMTASGGIEFREFSGSSSAGTQIKPVYELELNYQPFDGTTLALRGSLRTENSAVLGGQDYYHTSIGISARQRLLQRIYLALAFGYEHSNYFSTVNGMDASREDNYFFFQPAVDLTLRVTGVSEPITFIDKTTRLHPSNSMTINLDFAPQSRIRHRRLFGDFCAAIFAASVLCLVSSGVAQSPPSSQTQSSAGAPSQTGAAANSASIQAPLASVSAPAGYILSANDLVGVEVFGEDDLRTSGRLNPEGNLSLPLLGSVKLAGLTLTQAAARLTELYRKDYLVDPKVNVILAGFAKRRFIMMGQVNHPGSFEMPDESPNGIDLLEAIAIAGGYTRIAAPERISVRRQTNNGEDIIRVNAKRMAKGDGAFRVLPGDSITIGESIF